MSHRDDLSLGMGFGLLIAALMTAVVTMIAPEAVTPWLIVAGVGSAGAFKIWQEW